MYISIEDKKEYTQDFLKYLNKRMLTLGLTYMNQKRSKLIPVNNYLKESVFTGVRRPTAQQIIVAGLNNFQFKRTNSKLIIQINPSIKVPQVNSMLLETACKIIDQGNLELTPFPIFTYVFNYVKDNLLDIYSDYTFGVVM